MRCPVGQEMLVQTYRCSQEARISPMRSQVRGLALSLCIIIMAVVTSAHGIVVGVTDTSEFDNPSSPWYGMTLDGMGKVGGGCAVAVGNRYFLSVAHFSVSPGAQVVMVDGTSYTVTEVTNAPALLGQTDKVDLRIIKVAEEMPDWYRMHDDSYPLYTPVIMAGRGYSGTATATTFLPATSGAAWRWGTNKIDGVVWMPVDTPYGHFKSLCIEMGFKASETTYEAGFATGDSGGGTFLLDDNQWKLIGINAYIDRKGVLDPPPYDVSYAVSVLNYIDWINTIIPTGNVSGDDLINADDIDWMFGYLDSLGGSGTVPPEDHLNDLDSSGIIDSADVDFLVRRILGTEYGDFNLDGTVDTVDLTILATSFGLTGDVGWADGDANGDGVIDTVDLTIVGTYFGFVAASGGPFSTPEPASICLMGAAALLALKRRRRV